MAFFAFRFQLKGIWVGELASSTPENAIRHVFLGNRSTSPFTIMPDVGLFTATEPVSGEMKVVIKYSVEINGLPVYSESYDVDTLAKELEQDEPKAVELWARR